MSNIQNILKRFIQWGTALVLFVPILVNGKYLFPYIHMKNMSFRLIVSVLIVAAVWLAIERGVFSGKKNYLLYTLGLFFLVSSLATVFGFNPYNSWWSNYERMEGLVTIGMLVIYFWLIIQVFTSRQEWFWLLRASLLAAILVSIYGLLQIWGVQNTWILPASSIRISSTIGNPAFFASYLMFNLFFAGILFYLDKIKWWRIAYVLIAIFFILMIYNTGTRGPIIGLVGSGFLMGTLYWFKASRKAKQIIGALFIVVILFSGFLYSQRDSRWIKNYHAFDRVANISLQDTTTGDRLLTWQTSWQSFTDRPILGWGPDNYRYGFNKYYNPNLHEQWFDRAHSVIFDYLNASGVLGLLSYLLVLGAAVYYLWHHRQRDYGLSVIVFGLLSAYFIQNLFVFDTLNTYLPLFLTLAFISYLNSQGKDIEAENWQVPNVFRALKTLVLGILILLVIIWDYQVLLKPARANITAIEAYKNTVVAPETALDYFDQALAIDTYGNREITLQLASFATGALHNQQIPNNMKNKIFNAANDASLKILEGDPADIQLRLLLVSLYQSYATFDRSYIGKAIELLEPHISDSPNRLEIYYSLAQSYLAAGEVNSAVNYLEQAFAITKERPPFYLNLLNVYSQLEDTSRFVELAQEYTNKFNLEPNQYRQLAQFYFTARLFDQSKNMLIQKVIPSQVDNLQNYTALASIYKAQGEYDEAISVMQQAGKINTSWAGEIANIIKQLEKERDSIGGE